MTDPERPHPADPAEGEADEPDEGGRTPHPEDPAEGGDDVGGGGADTP